MILIADITGYTRFLSVTDVEHANFVIANLFSAMLDESPSDLKVMEVEGDALFCWIPREEGGFGIDRFIDLVHHQFVRFIGVQRWFTEVRGSECGCRACVNVGGLKIKFILHYGQAGSYRIANFEKIAGLDVIVAHRLMKNSVPEEEYVLMTDAIEPGPVSQGSQWKWCEGEDNYPIIGRISYKYLRLNRGLVHDVIVPPFVDEIDSLTHRL